MKKIFSVSVSIMLLITALTSCSTKSTLQPVAVAQQTVQSKSLVNNPDELPPVGDESDLMSAVDSNFQIIPAAFDCLFSITLKEQDSIKDSINISQAFVEKNIKSLVGSYDIRLSPEANKRSNTYYFRFYKLKNTDTFTVKIKQLRTLLEKTSLRTNLLDKKTGNYLFLETN